MGERVALYLRVSTGVQSLDGQRHELREFAAANGLEVVREVADHGEKRADLYRPGLDELRELAASGAMTEVWAWNYDRYGEYPIPEVFAWEMERKGVVLRAMGDGGEGIGGDIFRAVGGIISRKDQQDRVRKSKMGKREKAREGKIVGGPSVAYGFVKDGDHYIVDEERMPTIRRIFREAAEGEPVHSITRGLERDGITSARGMAWSRVMIRRVVLGGLYAPRTVAELRDLGVAEKVLSGDPGEGLPGLDPERFYGLYWFGEVPVPVPWSGVGPKTAKAARERLGKHRQSSKAAGRIWELSGGVMVCASCGWRMGTTAVNRSNGRSNRYYRCTKCYSEKKCPNNKVWNADKIEPQVWGAVRGAMGNAELLREAKERYLEAERKRLRPPENAEALAGRLEEIVAERERRLKQNARGILPDAECDHIVRGLDEEKAAIAESLVPAANAEEVLRQSERAISDLYDVIAEKGGGKTVEAEPPGERIKTYRKVGLTILAGRDGELSLRWFGDQSVVGSDTPRP